MRAPVPRQPLYDTYWRFAAERQAIFHRRLDGQPSPWTADPILDVFKFCNAYRASDRVSQFLLRDVIYRHDVGADDLLMRVVLFRLFSKIETWPSTEENHRANLHNA